MASNNAMKMKKLIYIITLCLCICSIANAQTDNLRRKKTSTVQKSNPVPNKPKNNDIHKQQKSSPVSKVQSSVSKIEQKEEKAEKEVVQSTIKVDITSNVSARVYVDGSTYDDNLFSTLHSIVLSPGEHTITLIGDSSYKIKKETKNISDSQRSFYFLLEREQESHSTIVASNIQQPTLPTSTAPSEKIDVHNLQSSSSVKKSSFNNGVLAIDGITYQFVLVEKGKFVMDEKTSYVVTLTNDYYVGTTEVTQALWKTVMGNNPSCFIGDNNPVESVSWNECQEFVSRLNSMTGKNFRLPTEAEWEFASRGGKKSKHYEYSGSNNIDNVAWYEGNSGRTTHAVATKQPNELGIYDMSGNVGELCNDWYGVYSYNAKTNPIGPDNGSYHVVRGGGWGNYAGICRSSFRSYARSDDRGYYVGFRLTLSK